MSLDPRDPIRTALEVDRPVLIFLAGPNGAGKTTFFNAYLEDLGLPFINADVIARDSRERPATTSSEEVDRQGFRLAEELREAHLTAGLSFCTETVFSDPHGAKLGFLDRARAAGYVLFLVFIGLDNPLLSVARVQQRVEAGGHDVPDEKLTGRFPRTLANLRAAIPRVEEAFLFDNSSADQPFRPVAVYSRGRLVAHFPPLPSWTRDLPDLPAALEASS